MMIGSALAASSQLELARRLIEAGGAPNIGSANSHTKQKSRTIAFFFTALIYDRKVVL